MSKYPEIDLTNLRRYSIQSRISKVQEKMFAKTASTSLSGFWESVPDVLKAHDMKELVATCVQAVQSGKPIYFGIGGHVIKCGLAPLFIELMKHGACKGIACNGSVTIHDYEIAMFGKTSEDVSQALDDGSFGMASDTADGINQITKDASRDGYGLGQALGKALSDAPFGEYSLLAKAYQYQVPVTVHTAIGTDIIHQHQSADGAAIGETSLRDFRIFCHNLIDLNDGGVFITVGSSVIIPEVFLKAVSVVRNLGYPLQNFTTAVFDMNLHYRPMVNVVQRPVQQSGKGYYFVGHHEIMIPLFVNSLLEKL
jgi:deoxyhypusine synthase